MGLNQPPQGLRPLTNKSKQPAKVTVAVAPGDTLLVSDELAAQLQNSSSSLVDPATVPAPSATTVEDAAPADPTDDTDQADDAPKRTRKPKA